MLRGHGPTRGDVVASAAAMRPSKNPSKVPPHILKMQPYVAGKPLEELEREYGIHDAIKLASNENPLGPSPRALAAAMEALGTVHRYPDAAQHAVRTRIAAHCGVTPGEVIVGAGSNELLDLLGRGFTVPGDHVVFAEPSFPIYKLMAQADQLEATMVDLDADQVHDLDAMAAACRSATRLVIVANPNNPTGTYVHRARLEKFFRDVPPEILVVLDEAYTEYVTVDDPADGIALRGCRDNLVVLRTFSKAYGLAGLRVGYGIAPAEVIAVLDRVRAPFNVSSVACAAAIAALDDHDHLARSVTLNTVERRRLTHELRALGVSVLPSEANFVFAETPRPATEIYAELLRRGVIVRPIAGSRLTRCVRITVGTRDENDRLLGAITAVLRP